MGRHPSALKLLITTGCSCLFITLTIGVATGGPLVRFDRSMADALHTYASDASGLTYFFHIVSILGSLEVLALVGVLVAVALLVRSSCLAFAAWLIAVLGGEVLNLLLKDLFARPRPPSSAHWWSRSPTAFPADRRWSPWLCTGCLPSSSCSPQER